jgi:hypothetical protein
MATVGKRYGYGWGERMEVSADSVLFTPYGRDERYSHDLQVWNAWDSPSLSSCMYVEQ